MVWHSNRIHHEISLSRKRICANDPDRGGSNSARTRSVRRRTIFVLSPRAQQQPAPSDLRVIPSRHDIGTRAENQVEVIRKDRKPQQIDAHRAGQFFSSSSIHCLR
jgi:hypothetical protein